jgi:DNA polymerase-3 subunit delta'
MAHAYLLYGDKGLGKALFASAFANLMLCATPIETNDSSRPVRIACQQCANCLQSASGHHPDIIHIRPEDGSKNIKIEQIRLLSEFVIRSSHSGGAKIAIINEAHLLNTNAANALLKTLEEPNHNTFLFLVSDYPGRLMATIRSRCQQLPFTKPKKEMASKWLHGILGEGNTDIFLAASMDRPLIALQYAESDSLLHRQQFLQSLCDIKLDKGSIQSSLTLSSKIGEVEVLQHFAESLSTLIKYMLTEGSEN